VETVGPDDHHHHPESQRFSALQSKIR